MNPMRLRFGKAVTPLVGLLIVAAAPAVATADGGGDVESKLSAARELFARVQKMVVVYVAKTDLSSRLQGSRSIAGRSRRPSGDSGSFSTAFRRAGITSRRGPPAVADGAGGVDGTGPPDRRVAAEMRWIDEAVLSWSVVSGTRPGPHDRRDHPDRVPGGPARVPRRLRRAQERRGSRGESQRSGD